MKFNYNFDQEKKLLTAEISGKYDFEEYNVFYIEILKDAEDKGITSILWDARGLDVSETSTDDIEKQVMFMKTYSLTRKSGKGVWLVNDQLSFGMGRMFQIIAEANNVFTRKFKMKVMKNLHEAENWLSE